MGQLLNRSSKTHQQCWYKTFVPARLTMDLFSPYFRVFGLSYDRLSTGFCFGLRFVISGLNCYGFNQQPTSQCDLWSQIPQNIGSYKDTQQSTETKPQHHQTHHWDMGRYDSTLQMKSKTYTYLEFGRIDATTVFVKFLRGELCDLLLLFQNKVFLLTTFLE